MAPSLPGGVHPLEHEQHGAGRLRPQAVVQRVELLEQRRERGPPCGLVGHPEPVTRVAPVEAARAPA